jgi:hypothetical protein
MRLLVASAVAFLISGCGSDNAPQACSTLCAPDAGYPPTWDDLLDDQACSGGFVGQYAACPGFNCVVFNEKPSLGRVYCYDAATGAFTLHEGFRYPQKYCVCGPLGAAIPNLSSCVLMPPPSLPPCSSDLGMPVDMAVHDALTSD